MVVYSKVEALVPKQLYEFNRNSGYEVVQGFASAGFFLNFSITHLDDVTAAILWKVSLQCHALNLDQKGRFLHIGGPWKSRKEFKISANYGNNFNPKWPTESDPCRNVLR